MTFTAKKKKRLNEDTVKLILKFTWKDLKQPKQSF